MPFADRDAALPIQKIDAMVHIVRDQVSGQFKALVVTDLDPDDGAKIAREVTKWCTDPRTTTMVISSNIAINWVEI